MSNTLHLDKTHEYQACHIDGWRLWRSQLNWLANRLWKLHLANFDVFDVREYDSFEQARAALLEMRAAGMYTLTPPKPTYKLVNAATGEARTGTARQLADSFNYKHTYQIDRLIANGYSRGRLKGWRLAST